MATIPNGSWQHPSLKVSLLARSILDTAWDAEQWAQIESKIPTVLAETKL